MNNPKDIKNDRYREAAARINSSIESEHYFEAITIVESILSDRISSFIKSTDTLTASSIDKLGFAQLITIWRVTITNPGSIWGQCADLINSVDSWRKDRNKYVHGLVKFPNQKASMVSTSEFIRGAKSTAITGRDLAEKVGEWRAEQISIKSAYTKMHNK